MAILSVASGVLRRMLSSSMVEGRTKKSGMKKVTRPLNSASSPACGTLARPMCQLGAASPGAMCTNSTALGSAVLHSICLLKAGLHMRGCRHPAQEHKQHHAKICNDKTGERVVFSALHSAP